MKRPRQALILAAGCGARLGEHTRDTPKALLSLGSETVLARQLRQLSARGVREVTVVTGHAAEAFARTALPDDAELSVCFTRNPDFARSGSALSLLAGAAKVRDEGALWVTHGDLVLDDRMLDACLAEPHGSITLADESWRRETGDEVLMWSEGSHVSGIMKREAPEAAPRVGEFVGLNLFSERFWTAFVAFCTQRVAHDRTLNYEEPILHEFLQSREQRCSAAFTRGLRWVNINYEADLERARTRFGSKH